MIIQILYRQKLNFSFCLINHGNFLRWNLPVLPTEEDAGWAAGPVWTPCRNRYSYSYLASNPSIPLDVSTWSVYVAKVRGSWKGNSGMPHSEGSLSTSRYAL